MLKCAAAVEALKDQALELPTNRLLAGNDKVLRLQMTRRQES